MDVIDDDDIANGVLIETRRRTARERLEEHADYLDRQGRRTLAADLRGLIRAVESLTVLAEAHVSGSAKVSPEAIALAGRKFMEVETHGR